MGFTGLFDVNSSVQEAQANNAAASARWTAFRSDFEGLKPETTETFNMAVADDRQGYNRAYLDNVTEYVGNFEPERLAELNTQELMTVYTKLRDLNAFDEMTQLFENTQDNGFKNAPIVQEFAAVAYNKLGRPSDALEVSGRLLETGYSDAEVYAAQGKSYQIQKSAAEDLAQSLDGADPAQIAGAESQYRKAFGLDDSAPLPDRDALITQAQDIVEMSRETYHRGFTQEFDYYPGINAAYGDLEVGDFSGAVRTAELTHLATLRDGGLDTTDYWRTSTMVESLVISGGDEADITRALSTLVSYEDVPDWQLKSTLDALNDRVKPALERVIESGGEHVAQARTSLDRITQVGDVLERRMDDPSFRLDTDTFRTPSGAVTDLIRDNSFSYRGMSTWDSQVVAGNMRFGGVVADHVVTSRDRAEFGQLIEKPIDDLMTALGGNIEDLPDAARGQTLSQIADPDVFLETSQKLIRANFATEERNLEVIDGADHHEKFDAPVEGMNKLAGVPTSPDERHNFDSRTSLSAEFAKGLGDCRHHAQAQQLLFDEWQRDQMDRAMLDAHNAATPEARQVAIDQFETLRQTELRTFDVEVYAEIQIEDTYRPTRGEVGVDGRSAAETFVAGDEMVRVEDHTMNMLLRHDDTGNVVSARLADSFYQNTYEWGNGDIDLDAIQDINGKLSLPAGQLMGVAGAAGNAVDVYLQPTPYAGDRRSLAHGDTGVVWERGVSYEEFDLLQAIENRETVNDNIARASAELPNTRLDGDQIWSRLSAKLEADGAQLPETARRPDLRLIVNNDGAEEISFRNPGGHSDQMEKIPVGEAAMMMLEGDTLAEQQRNAALLDERYQLSERGITPEFLDDLSAGKLDGILQEAYGPAPLEKQASRLEYVTWGEADGSKVDIEPVKGANAAYGVRPPSNEQVFLVKADSLDGAALNGTGTVAERLNADGMIAVAVEPVLDDKWQPTGEFKTRPIDIEVAKGYYGDNFDKIPVIELDSPDSIKNIDLSPTRFNSINPDAYFNHDASRTAEKTATIEARPAAAGEEIVTVMKDGHVETRNTANAGDYVVTNPDGEQYIVPGEKFDQKYVSTDVEGTYKPSGGPAKVMVLDEDVRFTAPWGEEMSIKAGGVLVYNGPGDVYGIQPDEFQKTYSFTDNIVDEVPRVRLTEPDTPHLKTHIDDAPEITRTSLDIDLPEHQRGVGNAISDVNTRLGSSAQVGASAYGLVMGTRNFMNSLEEGDNAGIAVSGADVAISAIDVGVDIASARGYAVSAGLTSTMAKANIALTIADIGYQVYKEDGNFIDEDGSIGHKGERLIAGTATAGVAMGTSMAVSSALAGTAITGAAAVAAPVVIAGAAVYVTAEVADGIITNSRAWEDIDRRNEELTSPQKMQYIDDDEPALDHFWQCKLSLLQHSDHMDESRMNVGEIIRHEPVEWQGQEIGCIENFEDIDFSDPKNLAEFERMLDLVIEEQTQIKEDNSSIMPRWIRGDSSVVKEDAAKHQIMQAQGAKQEIEMFKEEMKEYLNVKPQLDEIREMQAESAEAMMSTFDENANNYTALDESLSEYLDVQNEILEKAESMPEGRHKDKVLQETKANIESVTEKQTEVQELLEQHREQQASLQQEQVEPQNAGGVYQWDRTQSIASVGGYDFEGKGPLGGQISFDPDHEQPSLSEDVFNASMAADETAQLRTGVEPYVDPSIELEQTQPSEDSTYKVASMGM